MEAASLGTKAVSKEEDPTNRRVELMLGVLASSILLFIAGMVIFTFVKGLPSFAANGLSWFGAAVTSTNSWPTSSIHRPIRPNTYTNSTPGLCSGPRS